MTVNKTRATEASVAAFVDALEPARRLDAKAVIKMMKNATGEKPKMWGPSIIGFGTQHYKYESGREGDTVLVGFSPRKAATVLYGLTGLQGRRRVARQVGETHHRQGLSLPQESLRRGSENLGEINR
jgi:hypothetical protein